MKLMLQTKMLAGFGAVLVLMGIVGWIGVSSLGTLSGLVNDMYDDQLLPIEHLGAVSEDFQRIRVNVLERVIATEKADQADAEKQMAENEKAMLANLDKYSKTRLSDQEKEWLAKFNSAWAAYKTDRDNVIKLDDQGKDQEAIALFHGSARQKSEALQEAMDKLIRINEDAGTVADKQAVDTLASTRTMMMGIVVFVVLLGLGIAFFLARSISQAVAVVAATAREIAQVDLPNLTARAQAIAGGDLTQSLTIKSEPVNVKSKDEIGQMAASFNEMIEQLHQTGDAFGQMIATLRATVGQILDNSSQLAEASGQLSAASQQAGAATEQISTTIQQVAKGNQEQSASVQETTAAVEQLSRAIDQIAKGAQDQASSIQKASASVAQLNVSVSQVADASKDVSSAGDQAQLAAASGADSVQKTVEGMLAIRESSRMVGTKIEELGNYSDQIGSIVETIDDIAEQTNLLALNAAIEAARAGEHGRGFAVVADEVRKLAERSSRSTKEIADLIARIQKGTQEAVSATERGTTEVEAGSRLAEEAGEALKKILSAVQVANAGVSRIATETQRMQVASEQVVSLMDSVSAVVEESSAATEEMAASSQQVDGAIQRVAAVSEETSAAAEEVSASTEEMTAQVEEMVAQARQLADMAEDLQGAVAQFRLGDAPGVVMKRRKEDRAGGHP